MHRAAGADDLFLHQLVAEHGVVGAHTQPWSERCYFTVPFGDDGLFQLGVRLYPDELRVRTYAVARRGPSQWMLRTGSAASYDDPATIGAGAVTVTIAEPMRRWDLSVRSDDLNLDARYEARAPAARCDVMRVVRGDVAVTELLAFFQSGRVTGQGRAGGEPFALAGVPAHRDRTWGYRRGTGSPDRGLATWVTMELADRCFVGWTYEKGDGTVAFTDGAWTCEDGELEAAGDFVHDYEFDPVSGLLTGGRLTVAGRTARFDVVTTVHMSQVEEATDPPEADFEQRSTWTGLDIGEIARGHRSVDDHRVVWSGPHGPGTGIVSVARGEHRRYGIPPPRTG